MPAGVSYDQLMRRETILGVLRRYHAPGNAFCMYYGLGMSATPSQQIYGINGQYDIFDGTRSMGTFSAPGAPPTRSQKKPIGSVPITVPRMYMSIPIEDNQLFATRDLGQNPQAPITGRGQQYFKNQVGFVKTKMNTTHEFMASRMFLGGFGIKALNTTTGTPVLVPCEKDDANVLVANDSKVKAAHMGNIGGLIAATWSNPATNIPAQLMDLQVQAARENGRELTDIWMTGTDAKYLFANEYLQKQTGIGNRVFDLWNPSREINEGQKFPDTGFTVVFGALPTWKFHVYNQGYVLPGTSEAQSAQTDSANWKTFIPANKAIITPPPGDWIGMVTGSELVQWNLLQGSSEMVMGFGMGMERAIEPPRTDVKMMYIGAPALLEPDAVYAPTVIF